VVRLAITEAVRRAMGVPEVLFARAANKQPTIAVMTTWATLESEAPELARFARDRLEAHKHLFLATLRADGGPRISGTEITIGNGELWIGGMVGSRKFDDLRRDPRLALHSNSDDPPAFKGDARITGRAEFVNDRAAREPYLSLFAEGEAPSDFELVRIRIEEVMSVAVAPSGDRLVYEIWRPGEPVRRKERA
jgi:general stress protein 26